MLKKIVQTVYKTIFFTNIIMRKRNKYQSLNLNFMKKMYNFLLLLFLAGTGFQSMAQINPGTNNLKHQWTFDDATGKDLVGKADGVPEGTATFTSKALSTVNGGFMSFSGTEIAINSYPEITTEVWFTPSGLNTTACNVLSYFGNTTGTLGTDYIFTSPSSCNRIRAAISCGNTTTPWSAENFVSQSGYIDDSKIHHMVATFSATTVTFFIDGVSLGSQEYTGSNALSAIGTQFAYLAKGGYSSDPTWKGLIHKYSLYDKVLTADEVLYLYQKGAEEQQVMATSVSNLVIDNHRPYANFNLTAANLINPITISVPEGITILNSEDNTITSLPANTKSVELRASWNTTTPVDGKITLTSGTSIVDLVIKSASDATCYTPLYADVQNLFEEFTGMYSLADFQGWGAKGVTDIIKDPANVYCGATSISVGDGVRIGTGSLDIKGGAATFLLPNTTYRVKLMVKTIGGTFQLGVDADPNVEFEIDTKGEWMALDTIFTTGATIGANMYFNNWACTGLIGYIDNFEIYIYNEPIITTSASAVSFDPETTLTSGFTVTSTNLTEDIILTAPKGITLASNILPAASIAQPVEVIWDGVTAINDFITLKSGNYTVKVLVKSLTASNTTCFNPLYTDRINIIPDPYLNDFANFSGWGQRSINSNPANVYCGSRSGLISGGSLDVLLTGLLMDNTSYRVKAMVKAASNTAQLGIYGWSVGLPDTVVRATLIGEWAPIDFVFTTGTLATNYGAFFNGSPGSYIDNWELYEMPANALSKVNNTSTKVFVLNGRIVADLNLNQTSNVEFAVYSVQGALISKEYFVADAGKTKRVLNVKTGSGVYVVKITVDGKSSYAKVLK